MLSSSGNYTCESSCPAGTFLHTSTSTCITCSPRCLSCTSATSCLVCNSSFVLFQGYCLSSCPTSYAPSNGTCIKCPSSCRTCLTITHCISCQLGLILVNGSCVSPPNNCTNGYFLNSQSTCQQCFPSCLTCSAGNSFNCLSCFSGYTLSNGVCIKDCNTN